MLIQIYVLGSKSFLVLKNLQIQFNAGYLERHLLFQVPPVERGYTVNFLVISGVFFLRSCYFSVKFPYSSDFAIFCIFYGQKKGDTNSIDLSKSN